MKRTKHGSLPSKGNKASTTGDIFELALQDERLTPVQDILARRGTNLSRFLAGSRIPRVLQTSLKLSVYDMKREYTQKFKHAEAAERIVEPMDIIFGRGQGISKYPGNVLLNRIAALNKADYQLLPRRSKAHTAAILMHYLVVFGGTRFLEIVEPPGKDVSNNSSTISCRVVNFDRSLEKVMQALRELPHALKRAKHKVTISGKGGKRSMTLLQPATTTTRIPRGRGKAIKGLCETNDQKIEI